MLLEKRNDNYFDKVLGEFFYPYSISNKSLMKTNIRETEDAYIMDIAVPGVNKEDIDIKLDNEYLKVSISQKEEKNDDKYLVQEFNMASYSRSYYVGNIEIDDIKAKLDNGILTLNILKIKEKEIKDKKINID